MNPYFWRMNQVPTSLQKGDLIAIVAPAKAIEREHVLFAKAFFEKEGFRVEIGEKQAKNAKTFRLRRKIPSSYEVLKCSQVV